MGYQSQLQHQSFAWWQKELVGPFEESKTGTGRNLKIFIFKRYCCQTYWYYDYLDDHQEPAGGGGRDVFAEQHDMKKLSKSDLKKN